MLGAPAKVSVLVLTLVAVLICHFAAAKRAPPCDGKCLVQHLMECCCSEDSSDIECATYAIENLEEWLKPVTILIVGKTGTGKTTLVRGLAGWTLTDPEEDLPMSRTKNVTAYRVVHNKISFIIYDSPGLKDKLDHANDHGYLMQMNAPDVLLFAMKMNDNEFYEQDIDTIKNVSDAFGWKVWEKAVFLLTFANMVENLDAKGEREKAIHYTRRRDDFALKVTETLEELSAKKDIANNIEVLPVGLVKQPYIPSDSRNANSRKRVSWVDEFWDSIFSILKRTSTAKSRIPQFAQEAEAKDKEEL